MWGPSTGRGMSRTDLTLGSAHLLFDLGQCLSFPLSQCICSVEPVNPPPLGYCEGSGERSTGGTCPRAWPLGELLGPRPCSWLGAGPRSLCCRPGSIPEGVSAETQRTGSEAHSSLDSKADQSNLLAHPTALRAPSMDRDPRRRGDLSQL